MAASEVTQAQHEEALLGFCIHNVDQAMGNALSELHPALLKGRSSGTAREFHGTQSIGRAIDVLRLIAASGDRGVRLSDLVLETGLKQPTVSRLVSALTRESLVEHDPVTRRYYVGLEAFILGAIASSRFGIHKFARCRQPSIAPSAAGRPACVNVMIEQVPAPVIDA
jgi:hypothetical protein